MAEEFSTYLNARRVRFHHKFFTMNDPAKWDEAKMRERIVTEMKNYARHIIRPRNDQTMRECREKFSGKHGFGRDDLAIALQLNVLMKSIFFSNIETYQRYYR